jgi:hypothetical protein
VVLLDAVDDQWFVDTLSDDDIDIPPEHHLAADQDSSKQCSAVPDICQHLHVKQNSGDPTDKTNTSVKEKTSNWSELALSEFVEHERQFATSSSTKFLSPLPAPTNSASSFSAPMFLSSSSGFSSSMSSSSALPF